MPANVETMFSANRIVPWHGLGKVIEEAPDSVAAIKLAGLDWDVVQTPIFARKQGGGAEGEFETIPNYFANVRSDNNNALGIVTGRYQIVQNREAFTFTDSLISEGEVKYETAGSLKEGRQVWMLARMNREYDILGDKFDPYLCFVNSHDGTGAVRVMMTPIRVVCQNTLNIAMRQANRAWSSTHVGDMASKMAQAQMTLGLATEYMDALNEEANILAGISVSPAQVKEILDELLPVSTKTSERQANTLFMKRQSIEQALKADDISRFNGTGWAVVNAVSDFVTHTEPYRKTQTFRENQFARVVNGDVLFDKTYQLLKAVA
jgi:phage/plasmid-like protein (TIGR03299 family)